MHVTLNMASSLDGRVAGADGRPIRLSSDEDLARVHALRRASDAILVGVGTVLADDPALTVRDDRPVEAPPLRVVLDSQLRTPPTARVVNGDPATIVLVAQGAGTECGDAKVVEAGTNEVELDRALATLAAEGVDRLLVEGGPTTARGFLLAGAVDVFSLYVAPRVLGSGPSLWEAMAHAEIELALTESRQLGEGVLLSFEA